MVLPCGRFNAVAVVGVLVQRAVDAVAAIFLHVLEVRVQHRTRTSPRPGLTPPVPQLRHRQHRRPHPVVHIFLRGLETGIRAVVSSSVRIRCYINGDLAAAIMTVLTWRKPG